jgi:hypothetical protein
VPANQYEFVTRWRVEATPDEVFDLLADATQYPRWWPSVWLRADLLEAGAAHGRGRRVRFVSRGWLPYRLRWTAHTVASERPILIVVEATGDFEGRGQWLFRPATPHETDAEYTWRIRAEKPLLRYLSPFLKPLFEANHHWAMARGEESLRRELARRRNDGTVR